jgi:lactoylglutathione lyase
MKFQGLFETHIHVADLERSAHFYENVLGLQLAYVEEKRRVRFYWIGGHNHTMLGVWEVEPSAIRRQHFAIRISRDDMKQAVQFLKERGLEVENFLNDGTERPLVFGWMPAVSIYFRDPDGHSLEFIATLPDKPRPDLGVVPWDEWEKLNGRTL